MQNKSQEAPQFPTDPPEKDGRDNLENQTDRPEAPPTDLTAGLVLPEHVEAVSDDGDVAEFVIEPLERGYGYTLGNSVRRTLVSSLPGTAVYAFRIDGVLHEHQTIPGVVEDVHQVIQNLKALILVLDDDVNEAELSIQVREAGSVTAGDINAPPSVRVLDPGQPILTLEEDRTLNMELRVDKGRGFRLSDQYDRRADDPVNLVPIDAIYNPVRRANFTVEETRVGERTDFDRLWLRVETDGSIRPEQAVATAAQLVREYLKFLLDFSEDGVTPDPDPGIPLSPHLQKQLARPIDELTEISVRSRNSLRKENIGTLGDLVRMTKQEVLSVDNFGQKSMEELLAFLGEHGIKLGMPLITGAEGELYLEDPAMSAGERSRSGDADLGRSALN